MRGIGALAIVVGHALIVFDLYKFVPHCQCGVDLFFALSGFVICHAYHERMQAGMSAGEFTVRRLIRLYPIIPVGVVLGAAIYSVRLIVHHERNLLAGVAGSSLLHLLFLPSPLLFGLDHDEGWTIDPPLWSLTAELIASLAFGFGLWKLRLRTLAAFALLGALGFGYYAFDSGMTNIGGQWLLVHVGVVRVVYPFCAGMILWHLTREHRPGWTMHPAFAIGLMLAVMMAPDMGRFNLAYGLFADWVAVPALVYVGAFRSSVDNRGVLLLGEISYAVYLVHFPILRAMCFASKLVGVFAHPALLIACVVIVSVVAGYVVWRYWDVPVRAKLTAWSKAKRAESVRRPALGARAD